MKIITIFSKLDVCLKKGMEFNMKLRVPNYYKKFHCIANNCTDCCCIGWEIDIDNKTANFYESVSNQFGKKLKANILWDKQKSFILDKNERCPFLNNKNLCEIFINLGEENLCNICTEHPRFYEWFNHIKEGGIGICCEEACRIILSQNSKFGTYEIEIPFEESDYYDEKVYNYLLEARGKIISSLENTSIFLNTRIRNTLLYTEKIQTNIDNNNFDFVDFPQYIENHTISKSNLEYILTFLTKLEPFDINWISNLKESINLTNLYFEKLNEFELANPEINKYLENLSIYFVWRYFLKGVFDNNIISKIKFMAISINVIKFLFFCYWQKNQKLDFKTCIEIAKNYSKEIEYSEENLLALENLDFIID